MEKTACLDFIRDNVLKLYEETIHDLKTNLTLIHFTLQSIQSMINPVDPIYSTINDLQKYWNKQMKLVNDANDLSKLQNGRLTPLFANCDIVNLTRNIVELAAPLCGKKKIEMVFLSALDKQVISLDSDMYERIILNLLSNAIKFTGDNGFIHISIREEAGFIAVDVIDNGIGIQQNIIDSIFNRYVTLSEHVSCEGSGIGLTIANTLAQMQGGHITVRSDETGAAFTIWLPNIVKQNDEEMFGNHIHFCDYYNDHIAQIELS